MSFDHTINKRKDVLQMIVSFIERCGIDRFTLTNFTAIDIDFKLLESRPGVDVIKGNRPYKLASGDYFTEIRIKDNQVFNDLRLGSKQLKQGYVLTSYLDVSVRHALLGNAQNMIMDECLKKVMEVFDYLETFYGIKCEYGDVCFSELEINCTLVNEKAFSEYNRGLHVVMASSKGKCWRNYGTYHTVNDTMTKLTVGTFFKERKSGSLGIYVYDKSQQMRDMKILDIEEDLMRIELRIVKRENVKRFLGSPYLYDISDGSIRNFFYKQVTKILVKPYQKWMVQNLKRLNSLIESYRSTYHRWISKFLADAANAEINNQMPLFLDIEQLAECKSIAGDAKSKRIMNEFNKRAAADETCFLRQSGKNIDNLFDRIETICGCAGIRKSIHVEFVK